jgi:hypothetical protein
MIVTHTTFKKDTQVFFVSYTDMPISNIEYIKSNIAKAYKIPIDDIEVEVEQRDISEYDVSEFGIYFWQNPFNAITGVRLNLELGSDEHLDSINQNNIEKYLQLL